MNFFQCLNLAQHWCAFVYNLLRMWIAQENDVQLNQSIAERGILSADIVRQISFFICVTTSRFLFSNVGLIKKDPYGEVL